MPLILHSGGRDRWISVSLRPAWSIKASSRTGSQATKKPCLEKQKQTKSTYATPSEAQRTLQKRTHEGSEKGYKGRFLDWSYQQ